MRFFAIAGVAVSALLTVALSTPAAAQQWPARQRHADRALSGRRQCRQRRARHRRQAAGKLGQPFIVENKAGAGGLIAGEAFAKSTPDGYALFVGANGPVLFAPKSPTRRL